jgi:hypothetical protein
MAASVYVRISTTSEDATAAAVGEGLAIPPGAPPDDPA